MKTNGTQDKSPVPGDDFIAYPEPQMSVIIWSRDTMNITLSRCSLSVFSNLAKVVSCSQSTLLLPVFTYDYT